MIAVQLDCHFLGVKGEMRAEHRVGAEMLFSVKPQQLCAWAAEQPHSIVWKGMIRDSSSFKCFLGAANAL